jgi:hypothetical protein
MDYLIRERIRQRLRKLQFIGCGFDSMEESDCPNLRCGIQIIGGKQDDDMDLPCDFYCPSVVCQIDINW